MPAGPQDVKKRHAKWLRENRHLRYMWIPHTDAVVVVTANPLPDGAKVPKDSGSYSEAEKTAAFQALLQVWQANEKDSSASISIILGDVITTTANPLPDGVKFPKDPGSY